MYTCPVCARVYPRPGACSDDGATLYGRDTSLVGQQVGNYRIERLIGRGGMGEVYLGIQPEIGARVAIKVLTGDAAASPTLVERFFAEARAVNLIHHESIVNVLDLAWTGDGRPYIMMEYLDGAPLAAHFAGGTAVPLGTLVRLAVEVLGALTAAHALGITHRDLKPENLFVTHLGRVKVLDFGIAKLNPELRLSGAGTQSQVLLGSPPYMSPEQARGQPVDGRSDLYSLGVILFEGATGRRPFHAESLYELLDHHVRTPPPAPSSFKPDLPRSLEAVILRCLAKDPAQRFQSASELAQALSEVAEALPKESLSPLGTAADRTVSLSPGPMTPATLAASVSTGPFDSRMATKSSSRWLLLAGALFALVALLGGAAGATWLVMRSPAAATLPVSTDEEVVDLHHFDAIAFLPKAQAQARTFFKDAELVTLTIPNVSVDGTVDLQTSQAFVGYSFRARGSGQGDPMAGVVIDECVANVIMSRSGVVATKSQGSCNTTYLPPPRCTPAKIMAKMGAQPGQRAMLQYYFAYQKGPTWSASFVGTMQAREFLDDC